MWVHNTQTTDDGEPHPREIRIAGMTEVATFDDQCNAYLENDENGEILVDNLDYVEQTDQPDYYESDPAGDEEPRHTDAEVDPNDVNRGPTPEDAGDSFEGVEREDPRPAATDAEDRANAVDERTEGEGDAEVTADPAEAEATDPHDQGQQGDRDAPQTERVEDRQHDEAAAETGEDVTDAEGAEDAPETGDTDEDDDDQPHTDGGLGYGESGYGE